MKLTRTKRTHSVAFNLTPMIDIVFLLIIFFMTVSQITRVVDHPIDLPVVPGSSSNKVAASVTINVSESGEIIVSGKKYSLKRTIQVLRKKLEQVGGDTDKIKLDLRCDKSCPSGYINQIIKELSGIGIKYVKIAVSENS